MLPSPAKKTPGFWRQAVWILIPMALLAGLALQTLWQDRERALLDARRGAQSLTDRMARMTAAEFRSLNRRYESAFDAWLEVQLQQVKLSSASAPDNPDASITPRPLASWNASVPDCPINLRPAVVVFYNDKGLLSPARIQTRLDPPGWYREMTPESADLWHSAQAASSSGDPSAGDKWNRVLQSELDPAARVIAEVELELAAEGATPAGTWHGQLERMAQLHGPWVTDNGLTVEARIIARRVLSRSSPLLNLELIRATANHALSAPNVITSRLVDSLKENFEGSAGDLQNAVQALEQIWISQQKTRRIWTAARNELLKTGGLNCLRVEDGTESYIVWKSEPTPGSATRPTNGDQPEPATVIQRARILPASVVRAAIDQARMKLGAQIPAYARFEIEAAGQIPPPNPSSLLPPDMQPLTAGGSDPVLLAETSAPWQESQIEQGVSFDVRLLLADPNSLFAQARRRSLLFGALIVGASVVSLLGLANARTAFLKQQQLAEMKGGFVSSVTHELRAPIASIRLLAESLQRGTIRDPSRQEEYFRWILQECRRLTSLIENVLDFARIDQGRKAYVREPTAVADLVLETVRSFTPLASEKGVGLQLHPQTEQLLMSLAPPHWDGRAIQQALVNLMDNAVKHSPAGSVVTVGVDQPPASPFIQLWVKDQGAGIPSSDHERIFEQFFRRGTELRRETQGIGIGLAIVRHIAEGHNGRVWVESESGKGCKFILELPSAATSSGQLKP